jgi:CRISPR-associated endonuclease/helicase Cas3
MPPTPFESFFRAATGGTAPYRYQTRLAELAELPDVLDVPTGLGKTAAVVLAWLWRRAGEHTLPRPPRRLVYCLPMRTLVEQTERAVCRWIGNLESAELLPRVPAVHVLMGGEDAGDWDVHPERDTVLVGTQDMLLSRLLNRGYGVRSRYRWPMHFGLLGNDCLWVMDEVQLMGSGLATTVQVDAFQKHYWTPAKPCHFLWMSATLGGSLFATRDRQEHGIDKIEPDRRFDLKPAERNEPAVQTRIGARKSIEFWNPPPGRGADRTEALARAIHANHQAGRLSLAILNTVPVARDLHRAVCETSSSAPTPPPETILLHSRFRPPDRQRQMDHLQGFLDRVNGKTGAAEGHPGLIVVSTQVVEAGVDISSVRLWSEVAPWPSVIQRLGRLNREGRQPDARAWFWVPGEGGEKDNHSGAPNEKRVGPYQGADLKTARQLLALLREKMGDDPAEYRPALDAVLATAESKQALEVEYDAVIRPHDFLELFETEPDLAGGFTDVSTYVRSQDRNVDAHVFWRNTRVPAVDDPDPAADELCPVPFYSLQMFLKASKWPARMWNPEARDGEGGWEARRWGDVRPGMTLRLWTGQGGYSADLGWTGDPRDNQIDPVLATGRPPERLAGDSASRGPHWVSLADHTDDVTAETEHLVTELELADELGAAALPVAARWHDAGKASPRWERAVGVYLDALREKVGNCPLRADALIGRLLDGFATQLDLPSGGPWAKFPDVREMAGREELSSQLWSDLQRSLHVRFRPGFRHEAVSALAAWQEWQRGSDTPLTGLAVYLIASHHGKVRTVLRATGRRDAAFGVEEGEQFPGWGELTPGPVALPTGARRFGAEGEWSADGKTFVPRWSRCTSWSALVASLLGGGGPDSATGSPGPGTDRGLTGLGPFRLAYLETVLRAADARASARPGRGKRS